MNILETLPALYGKLADWWPRLSTPDDYIEEARDYQELLDTAGHSWTPHPAHPA